MASDKTDSKKTDSTPAADALEDIAKAAADSATTTDPTPVSSELPGEAAATPALPANDSLITESAAAAAPASTEPAAAAPSEPVVVADKDVASASGGPSSDKMAEEIEVLTGEIQALEAKIERLTGGAVADTTKTDSPLQSPSLPPISGGPSPLSSSPAAISTPEPGAPPMPSTSDPITPPPSVETAKSDGDMIINKPTDGGSMPVPINTTPTNNAPVGDLYSDIKKREAEAPTPREELKEQTAPEGSSGLAIIAEVIAVFGIVLFVILVVSPFFREILGDDTYEAVQQIGWLSALGTLGVGLILMMFSKGKGLFKTMLFILLILAAVLFLALQGSSLISPVTDLVEPLVQFYR